MSLLKKIVRDEVLGLTRYAVKAGEPVNVDLTSNFGKLSSEIAGEDLDLHVLVCRRDDGKVYKVRTGKRKRVWR
jgi:hypothetical protein